MTVPVAVSVSVLYSLTEDRLAMFAIAADGTQQVLMVTRRLAVRLVNGFAHLLERTSAAAAEAPERARGDMVMFEHQGALSSISPSASPAESSSPRGGSVPPAAAVARATAKAVLMHAVDVTVTPERFVLTLKSDAGPVASMEVTRGDLHRLLALVRRKCDEAEWRVPIQTRWLDLKSGSMTLN